MRRAAKFTVGTACVGVMVAGIAFDRWGLTLVGFWGTCWVATWGVE